MNRNLNLIQKQYLTFYITHICMSTLLIKTLYRTIHCLSTPEKSFLRLTLHTSFSFYITNSKHFLPLKISLRKIQKLQEKFSQKHLSNLFMILVELNMVISYIMTLENQLC